MLASDDVVSIGSYDSSCIFNPQSGQRIPIHNRSNGIVPLVSFASMDSSHVYGVAIRSLLIIDERTGFADTLYSPLPERMRCVCSGRNDTLWMGGLTGLWAMPHGKAPVNMGEKKPELSERIDFIYYDSTLNRLWMSSKGKGLMLMESGRMIDLTGLNPAIPANCRAIYADDEKNIWVATNLGAFCVSETADGKFISREYSVRNGLSSNDIAGINRIGDTIWLAAADRIIRFPLSKYPVNTTAPPLQVKNILADGREIAPWPVDSVYEFTSGTGTITFSYSALSFKSLGNVNYSFRLDGADTSWKNTQSTEAVFYALPPGEYSFNLIARNNDGIASSPLVLRFAVLPPVWQRWWFIALAVFIITAVIAGIARNRFQRLRRQQVFNQRLVEMEMTALRAQMSPHFIFNAINSIHNFVLTGDQKTSATYLSMFARLIRNVLENSSQKQITLAKEIETLRLYLEIERMRFSEDFSFTISTDDHLDSEQVMIIPLLLQPYVENAIWHGLLHKKGHGSLLVSIRDARDMLLCIIDDNGVGRETAAINKQHRMGSDSSMGGEISQRRLNLLNDQYGTRYSVTYTDKKNGDGSSAGTRVELLIPKFIKQQPSE
jgi:two-component sensor histidine kinase